MRRIGAYVKQHWKEFLAVSLAAIPVALLLFHKGTQQAASNAITYIPATFGGGLADSGGSNAGTVDPVAASAAQTAALGSGVNQSTPGTPPPRSQPVNQSIPGAPPPRSQGVNQSPGRAVSSLLRRTVTGVGNFPSALAAGVTGPAQGGIRTSVEGNTGTVVQSPKIKRLMPR